jgi:6-phosphofructokinase 1
MISITTMDPLLNLVQITNHDEFTLPPPPSLKKISKENSEEKINGDGEKRKKRIGILTSGGDSSGMNPAVRSITRYSIHKGMEPYAIMDGYDGLVQGGDKIKRFGWEDVRGLLSVVYIILFL